ncbi:helix-turn-helix domain-containing protein [Streptomyces sp. O3]
MTKARGAAVEEFAAEVRALKERSGRSYESLARRLNVSASTLYRYCSGEAVPAEFTPVEQLARLCGVSADERLRLQRLWILADAARRPATAASARTPAGAGKDSVASEQPRQTEAFHVKQTPQPDPGPSEFLSPESQPPSPDPAAQEPAPVPDGPSPKPRIHRRWALLGAAAAVVALAGAGVGALAVSGSPSSAAPESPSSSGPDAISRTSPGSGGGSAGDRERSLAAAEAPFAWSVRTELAPDGCGHYYLADRTPKDVPPPPLPQDAAPWIASLDAVSGGLTEVHITFQGASEKSVVLEALRVRVTDRAEPLKWNVFRTTGGCGGAFSPRLLSVDLDQPRPRVRPVGGFDGEQEREIPPVSFPYKVSSTEPEELIVRAETTDCDCQWSLELEWSSQGRSGTVKINDENGRPFRTSGMEGRPQFGYDDQGRRWADYGSVLR